MVIDSFLFNGELELLELRLKVLYNYVDRFTIVEGNRTFRGDPKSMMCKEYLKTLGFDNDPKIKLIEVDLTSIDNTNDPNIIENKCRDLQFTSCNDSDIIIMADIDELLHPQYINYQCNYINNNPNNLLLGGIYNLEYQVNYALSEDGVSPTIRRQPLMAKGLFWKKNKLSQVRNLIMKGGHIDSFPFELDWLNDIKHGWHLSWMGDTNEKLNKLNSHSWYLESDPIREKLRDDNIKDKIINFNPTNGGKDILERKEYSLIKFDYTELFKVMDNIGNLPHIKKYLLNN